MPREPNPREARDTRAMSARHSERRRSARWRAGLQGAHGVHPRVWTSAWPPVSDPCATRLCVRIRGRAVLACVAMRIPASVSMIARVAGLLAAMSVGACTHAGGRLMVDVPKLLPYQPPDIDEITGIDS